MGVAAVGELGLGLWSITKGEPYAIWINNLALALLLFIILILMEYAMRLERDIAILKQEEKGGGEV